MKDAKWVESGFNPLWNGLCERGKTGGSCRVKPTAGFQLSKGVLLQCHTARQKLCRSKMCRFCKGTVTAIAAHLQTCFPAGNLVQRSAERVTLVAVPLNVVFDAVTFFEHVKEMECRAIKAPQQVHMSV